MRNMKNFYDISKSLNIIIWIELILLLLFLFIILIIFKYLTIFVVFELLVKNTYLYKLIILLNLTL